MASDAPNPQSLQSWKEAFQYPIPTVRRVEQELRRDINSNKEKLRALVGARYRDLLGTAETIVVMNTEIQEIEANLSDIGRRCSSKVIDTKIADLHRLQDEGRQKDSKNRTLAAQLALLHRCTSTISRLLRKHDSSLTASKLLVISRLLHKTLSQYPNVPPFIETLRKQLRTLRETMLTRINRRLSAPNCTPDEIIDAMAAYCLATSASSADVIQHFHQVRQTSIERLLKQEGAWGDNISKALNLYIRTLQNSKTLFSRRLSDALGKLKAQPLVMDNDVRQIGDLDLDVFERWVAGDVKNFTPWIKLNDMTRSDAEKAIKIWSREAFETFIKGSKASLKSQLNFSDVITLRKTAFDIWLASAPITPTHSSTEILEGLRDLFNGQLSIILRSQADQIKSVGERISTTVKTWDDERKTERLSLWDPRFISADYSDGAETFKKALQDTLLGHDAKMAAVLHDYGAWLKTIKSSKTLIDDLRQSRWEDNLDEDVDETEDSDIDWVGTLNEDDPYLLSREQGSAVAEALMNLEKLFGQFVDIDDDSNIRERAAFLLRLIRDIRNDLPLEVMPDQSLDFGRGIIPPLQKMLVSEVINRVLPLKMVPAFKPRNGGLPGRTLWEGDPALPVQPLPTTFRFLRRVSESMESTGADLWNPSTLKVLKDQLAAALSKSIISEIEQVQSSKRSSTKSVVDGEKEEESETDGLPDQKADKVNGSAVEDLEQDWQIQVIFDTMYLRAALSTQNTSTNPIDAVVIKASSEVLSHETISTRLQKAAIEYWKRTDLLFGLLNNQVNK